MTRHFLRDDDLTGAEQLEIFVDEVIPILQRRGLFRSEYEGTTLRDHYGLERPASRFAGSAANALA